MAAETSFETNLNNVTDRLTNVTIQEESQINEDMDSDNVLLLIKDRKNKKQGCDWEVLLNECMRRYSLDEERFKASISKLINIGCIKEVKRLNRITFSLLQPEIPNPVLHYDNEEMFSDFLDFKLHVTETLASLNERLERQNSTLEMKEVVISLLQQELNRTQETLKIALSQNSELLKCLSNSPKENSVESHKTVETVDIIDNDVLKDIPFDSSVVETSVVESIPKPNEYTIENQLSNFREKMRIDYNSKKHSEEKTIVDVNKKASKTDKKVKSKRGEIIVCGDSILNNIVGNGLSNKNAKVSVKNFPGANSDDMLHHIQPIIKRKPDHIILHIGTNDITSGCNTGENLEEIRKLIHDQSPSTQLIISEVLIREDGKDKKMMLEKVKRINMIIGKFCEKYNLHLILHENVTSKMLSSRKLHLNGTGISCFAQNLKNFISNTC